MPAAPGPLPPARSVLVFAPHPDDEVFGCAGALALYAAQQVSVRVVVVSDGGAQVGPGQRDEHTAGRAMETRSALACLGVDSVEFWGCSDRSLGADEALPQRIRLAIEAEAPDVVLAPSLWEIHPDHLAVGRAVLDSARAIVAPPRILFYEVGSAQRVNLLLDITSVWGHKRRAMACFASQQRWQDYGRHIEALNIWRTYTLPNYVSHAEGFTCIEPDQLKHFEGVPGDPMSIFLRMGQEAVLAQADVFQEALRQQLVASERDRLHAVSELLHKDEAIVRLEADRVQREATISNLQADRDRQARIQAELADRLAQSMASAAALQKALDDVFLSTSWRVTAPIRWIRMAFRRI